MNGGVSARLLAGLAKKNFLIARNKCGAPSNNEDAAKVVGYIYYFNIVPPIHHFYCSSCVYARVAICYSPLLLLLLHNSNNITAYAMG